MTSPSVSIVLDCTTKGELDLSYLPTLKSNEFLAKLETCDQLYKSKEYYRWGREVATLCSDNFIEDPNWLLLAGRVQMKQLSDSVPKTFSKCAQVMDRLQHMGYLNFVRDNADRLDKLIKPERDYDYTFFSVSVMMESYLARVKNYDDYLGIVETPQYMHLRQAVFLWFQLDDEVERWNNIEREYELLSTKMFTHASPTIFNSGMHRHTLTSCFTMSTEDDTEDITDKYKYSAIFSKGGGGIGKSFSALRHSEVCQREQKTNIINWMKIEQDYMVTFNQGMKRKGSSAIYLNVWHIDVEKFIDIRLPSETTAQENERLRDLFNALWIQDEFMRRVKDDKHWTLFCPNVVKGLDKLWGEEFEIAYRNYESLYDSGKIKYAKRLRARDLFNKIIVAQIETGIPYMLYADAVNRKSNQMNCGPILLSNLCVAGDTQILTRTGYHDIESLAGQDVEVWNGEEWSMSRVEKTNTNQDLLKISFSNGSVLQCTEYHKFWIKNYYHRSAKQIQAKDLKLGDKLIEYQLPTGEVFNDVKVTKIQEGRKGVDTFCFNEPKRHMGIFNGILTGNCSEITLHTDNDNIGSCNLANIVLHKCIDYTPEGPAYNYSKLEEVARFVTRSMDRVIDMNYYPDSVPEVKYSNDKNRPLGIGVQGLADVFAILRIPWESDDAKVVNDQIFETLHYACVSESCELAKRYGRYPAFDGSPTSKGLFQFDLWTLEKNRSSVPDFDSTNLPTPSPRYNWEALRSEMKTHGLRHSLLNALMPTASSASIVGSTESFEPIKQCVFSRNVLAGQYVVMNTYCIDDLKQLGLWKHDTIQSIWDNHGSVQYISEDGLSPNEVAKLKEIKSLYKTAYEISQRTLVDLGVDRGKYICQSQSQNCFMAQPTKKKLMSYHMYAWEKGLKTGMYYLKQQQRNNAINFSESSFHVESDDTKDKKDKKNVVCTDEVCIVCQ